MSGYLSAADREALRHHCCSLGSANAMLADIERIVAQHRAAAWDEGVTKASPHGGGYLRSFYAENPYRIEATS